MRMNNAPKTALQTAGFTRMQSLGRQMIGLSLLVLFIIGVSLVQLPPHPEGKSASSRWRLRSTSFHAASGVSPLESESCERGGGRASPCLSSGLSSRCFALSPPCSFCHASRQRRPMGGRGTQTQRPLIPHPACFRREAAPVLHEPPSPLGTS